MSETNNLPSSERLVLRFAKPPKAVNTSQTGAGWKASAGRSTKARMAVRGAYIAAAVERSQTLADLPRQAVGDLWELAVAWVNKGTAPDVENAWAALKPYVDACKQVVVRMGVNIESGAPILIDDSPKVLERSITIDTGRPSLTLTFSRTGRKAKTKAPRKTQAKVKVEATPLCAPVDLVPFEPAETYCLHCLLSYPSPLFAEHPCEKRRRKGIHEEHWPAGKEAEVLIAARILSLIAAKDPLSEMELNWLDARFFYGDLDGSREKAVELWAQGVMLHHDKDEPQLLLFEEDPQVSRLALMQRHNDLRARIVELETIHGIKPIVAEAQAIRRAIARLA